MNENNALEALRNLRTEKLFILLEEGDVAGRVKVINPNGDVLNVSDIIFEDDVVEVPAAQASEAFTPEQLAALTRYNQEQQRLALQPRPTPQEAGRGSTTRKLSSKRSRQSKPEPKGRLVANWRSPSFVFYRHKIEPLRPQDSFCITVDGEGDYVMTKAEFQDNFNNVILSPGYRQQGIFSYSTTPDKARKFLRAKADQA